MKKNLIIKPLNVDATASSLIDICSTYALQQYEPSNTQSLFESNVESSETKQRIISVNCRVKWRTLTEQGLVNHGSFYTGVPVN